MTTGTVSWATLNILGIQLQMAIRDEDIDLESGEYVPVGHIRKFDLEQYEQRNFVVKSNFSKTRIEPVMLNFLATTANLRNARSEQPNYNRGKVVEKSSGKLLFAISSYKNYTRVELSYPEIGNRTITKEEYIDSKWTRLNLRWKGGNRSLPLVQPKTLILK